MSKLITLIVLFHVLAFTAIAQGTSKPISREQLVYYLSQAINIQGLTDYCKTSTGLYPGPLDTNSFIVDNNELSANPTDTREKLFHQDLLSGKLFERYNDVLRLIRNVKPKLITDALTQWGAGAAWDPWQMEWRAYLNRCVHVVKDIKSIDSDIIVQAAMNEYVDNAMVNAIGDIPSWVFTEFGLPQQSRKFNKLSMAFGDYKTNNTHAWSYSDAIVPDISKLETKMLFYYLAVTYINMGVESLTFCQVELMNNQTLDPTPWGDLFQRLRKYADKHTGTRFLLITAGTSGMKDDKGHLLFDYHSAPVRPSEDKHLLNVNGGGCLIDAAQCWANKGKLYRASLGGTTPSGWYCNSLPGLVALDNWGPEVSKGGMRAGRGCNQYHWDEISWFGLQDQEYRNYWLRYASDQVRRLDSNIYFALPARRIMVCSSGPAGFHSVDYLANNPSADAALLPVPNTLDGSASGLIDRYQVQHCAGYGQEDVIKEIIARNAEGSK